MPHATEQRSRRDVLKAALGAGTTLAMAGARPRRRAWAADRPIMIGHQCDLTGALSSSGVWRDRAARAVIGWINKQGGIAGREVKYAVEDTETVPAVGIRKMRKLIQDDQCDFVIGSEHGGVGIASAPVAKETKTLYFPLNRTDQLTGKAGNRYVFRVQTTTRHCAIALAPWAVSTLGKNWTIIYADYAWGQAHRDNWSAEIDKAGGRILAKVGVPVGTQDHMPYLTGVDPKSDAVFLALLGPDTPRSATALQQIGFKGARLMADIVMELFDALEIPEVTQGAWGAGTLPFELAYNDTPHLRTMRELTGIDTDGREKGTGRISIIGNVWAAWETVNTIKLAVEKTGWKERRDHPKLVEFLEGVGKIPEGPGFPQGELLLRAQDHQSFMDFYLHRVEGKRVKTVHRISRDRLLYPPPVDYRQDSL